jgi:hypothetical protein
MKRQLDMGKLARTLGAERRGKVSALLADVGKPRSGYRRAGGDGRILGGRNGDSFLSPRRRSSDWRRSHPECADTGESTSSRCSSRPCSSRRRPGNSARLKPRSSSDRAGERAVERQLRCRGPRETSNGIERKDFVLLFPLLHAAYCAKLGPAG